MPIRFLPLLLLCSLSTFAQEFPDNHYPSQYFRNPLSVPISLAANFGELRANHYHMGLDIRTEQRENLPVYAAADGYVSQVKIEPFGFGQAIYITHPNGFTTLYAHLNSFAPALSAYVKQKQYEVSAWKMLLVLPPELFPVKKGDLIAYSGNMGGSQGPHLHFEIRRTKDDVNVNPMLFGLPIPDNTPPVIRKLALYDRNRSVYEQSPTVIAVRGSAGHFSIATPVVSTTASSVGFGIVGFDTQSGSNNPNGLFEATLFDNDQPVVGFQMDGISYSESRNINAHIDYKSKALTGTSIQQLFALPGYPHSIYRNFRPGGLVDLRDGSTHSIRIIVKDAYGNQSSLDFHIRQVAAGAPVAVTEGKSCYPGLLNAFETTDGGYYLGEHTLYDSVHVSFQAFDVNRPGVVSRIYSIGKTVVPVRDSILVRMKPTSRLSEEQKSRVLMQWFDSDRTEVRKVQWLGDVASASFRDFGNFQLIVDDIPPTISFTGVPSGADLRRASRLLVSVTDNFGNIKSFNAFLDGNWLLFTNDKERAFIYVFDEHCAPGKHELLVEAVDEAGNKATKSLSFTR